jgi:hypothetical protein
MTAPTGEGPQDGGPTLEQRLRMWAAWNDAERAAGKVPTFLNPHTVLGWLGPAGVAPSPQGELARLWAEVARLEQDRDEARKAIEASKAIRLEVEALMKTLIAQRDAARAEGQAEAFRAASAAARRLGADDVSKVLDLAARLAAPKGGDHA